MTDKAREKQLGEQLEAERQHVRQLSDRLEAAEKERDDYQRHSAKLAHDLNEAQVRCLGLTTEMDAAAGKAELADEIPWLMEVIRGLEGVASTHGYKASDADIARGKDIRERLAALSTQQVEQEAEK